MFTNIRQFIRHGKQAKNMATADDPIISMDSSLGSPTLHDLNDFDGNYTTLKQNLFSGTESNSSYPSSKDDMNTQVDIETLQTDETLDSNKTDEMKESFKEIPVDIAANKEESQQNQKKMKTGNKKDGYSKIATDLVNEEIEMRRQRELKQQIDRYQMLEKLGEGAFSIVYKALDKMTNEFVAVKLIRRFQLDEAQRATVLKEVTILRQLDHPNIVKFLNFIETDDYYYIVQECISGGEIFAEVVRFTYLSEDLSRHIIIQLAEAIKYLHEEVGVVHRDIKPENILFNPIHFIPTKPSSAIKYRKSDDVSTKKDEGVFKYSVGGGGIGAVKLADFGLSKQIWENNTKTPCGTVGYTAPEIVRDEKYSKEVDMWAIGCVLYILLCGFPPFYDERIESLTEKVAKGQFVFLSPWWDEISDEAKYCVSRLLTVNPSKRYTIEEFLNDPWILDFKQKGEAQLFKERQEKELARQRLLQQQDHDMLVSSSNSSLNSLNSNPQLLARMSPNMYSPAAVAIREAFDISAAVHRMGEEAALNKYKRNGTEHRFSHRQSKRGYLRQQQRSQELSSLCEDDEDENSVGESFEGMEIDEIKKIYNEQLKKSEKENSKGAVTDGNGIFMTPSNSNGAENGTGGTLNQNTVFNLDMNTATILGRRKKRALIA